MKSNNGSLNSNRTKNVSATSTPVQNMPIGSFQSGISNLYPAQSLVNNVSHFVKESPKGYINQNVITSMTYSMPISRINSKHGDRDKDSSAYGQK